MTQNVNDAARGEQPDSCLPAFIGYTARAECDGRSLHKAPHIVRSLQEYIDCYVCPQRPDVWQYYLVEQSDPPRANDFLPIGDKVYGLIPDPGSLYYLFQAVQLFFANGGEQAMIVSVGGFESPLGAPLPDADSEWMNPNVQLNDLLVGLTVLTGVNGPTLYVCPDAMLLDESHYSALTRAMLQQAAHMQMGMCLLDLPCGRKPDPLSYESAVNHFRIDVGNEALDHGVAYYPWLNTTLYNADKCHYGQLCGGDFEPLAALLLADADDAVAEVVESIRECQDEPDKIAEHHQNLLRVSATYRQIINKLVSLVNVLAPSGALAGIYAANDQSKGVWHAPANVGLNAVDDVTISLNDVQQRHLVPSATCGKAINVIRHFAATGLRIGGARTLDALSDEWRYVAVRRTALYIQQCCRQIVATKAGQRNDASLWQPLKQQLDEYLDTVYQAGGLHGDCAETSL